MLAALVPNPVAVTPGGGHAAAVSATATKTNNTSPAHHNGSRRRRIRCSQHLQAEQPQSRKKRCTQRGIGGGTVSATTAGRRASATRAIKKLSASDSSRPTATPTEETEKFHLHVSACRPPNRRRATPKRRVRRQFERTTAPLVPWRGSALLCASGWHDNGVAWQQPFRTPTSELFAQNDGERGKKISPRSC